MQDFNSEDEVFCCTIFRSDGVGIQERFDIQGLRDEARVECRSAAGHNRFQLDAGSCSIHPFTSAHPINDYQGIR